MKQSNKNRNVVTFDCTNCKNVYTRKTDLEEHMQKSHTKEKCENCSKEYKTKFELKRHMWRSHENIECNFCGNKLENRHELKRHKISEHKMTRVPECKFYEDGRCVDSEECLYEHKTTNQARGAAPKHLEQKIKFCRQGLRCVRSGCDIGDEGHKRIKEVPCKFQQRCKKQDCHFKHERSGSDFWESRNDSRSI